MSRSDFATIAGAVHASAERLIAAGIPAIEARLDAELLARHALGRWDRSTYIVRVQEPFAPDRLPEFEALVTRRIAREPIAYIVGHAEFWGLEFEVTRDVLIPRPETELIIESVLGLGLVRERGTQAQVNEEIPPAQEALPSDRVRLKADTTWPRPLLVEAGTGEGAPSAGATSVGRTIAGARQAPLQIVDVGTGSGCIAVALARELPRARLVATDVSAAAIEVARRNARRHGVEDRIAFLVDSFSGVANDCDVIVSNPPYVAERDRASLQPEVRDHEPASALFAGDDGLAVVAPLIERAWHDLAVDGGWLVFEFGFGQADAVRELLDNARAPLDAGSRAWADVEIINDLQGIPRVARARKSTR